jgi:uncharacterized membrane protein YkvA (DUF1232 family)
MLQKAYMCSIGTDLKITATKAKTEVVAIYLAFKHPQTPWHAKILALAVAIYAISPVDFIPDFIPVIGYLDDVIIVPLGILLVSKCIPESVMLECRANAQNYTGSCKGIKRWAIACVVLCWLMLLLAVVVLASKYLNTNRCN